MRSHDTDWPENRESDNKVPIWFVLCSWFNGIICLNQNSVLKYMKSHTRDQTCIDD